MPMPLPDRLEVVLVARPLVFVYLFADGTTLHRQRPRALVVVSSGHNRASRPAVAALLAQGVEGPNPILAHTVSILGNRESDVY
jgi:hypothetical protein